MSRRRQTSTLSPSRPPSRSTLVEDDVAEVVEPRAVDRVPEDLGCHDEHTAMRVHLHVAREDADRDPPERGLRLGARRRSEEHTSELQYSPISYAVFCFEKQH